MGVRDEIDAIAATSLPKRLQQLHDLLKRKGIDLAELEAASVKSVKFWQQGYKDADGEGQVQDLAGITFSPAWESGPEWPVVQPGPVYDVPKVKARARTGKGWRTAVVLPDMQIGYFRGDDGSLVPTHDERALSVALSVVRDVQPDVIVMHGDNADFPELSRYRLSPVFAQTTQATIDRCTLLGAELRDAAPKAAVYWLAGNHEERLPNFIVDNAVAAFGLRKGMSPESWPVMSMPYLCRMDDHAVTFLPGYPANTYWINDRLRVIHGSKVRQGGTAHLYLEDSRVSTLFGHVHRREWAELTRTSRDGARTIVAASAGCLCRTDGAVPSTKGGVDLDGRPIVSHENWQQGLWVVPFKPGDGPFVLEPVSIFDGWAMWRGTEYR